MSDQRHADPARPTRVRPRRSTTAAAPTNSSANAPNSEPTQLEAAQRTLDATRPRARRLYQPSERRELAADLAASGFDTSRPETATAPDRTPTPRPSRTSTRLERARKEEAVDRGCLVRTYTTRDHVCDDFLFLMSPASYPRAVDFSL